MITSGFSKMIKNFSKELIYSLKEIARDPFDGIGKPEPLKANLSGYWSRRINSEHRLVYTIVDRDLLIISCRFHYQR
jgi:toxin YoeB